MSDNELTLSELEQTVAVLAYIVLRHGEVYAPLFDKMEQALLRRRQQENATTRANRYLENICVHSGDWKKFALSSSV